MSNTLQNLLDDAERIVPQLVPAVNKLPEVVGVLIKQVEQIAGGELKKLEDDVLGIQTTAQAPAQEPPPLTGEAAAAAAAVAAAGQSGAVETELAETKKALALLEERLAQVEKDAAPQA